MTLVTFALPQESADFRRALRATDGRLGGGAGSPERAASRGHLPPAGGEEIRVIHLGIGQPAAAAAMRRALAAEKPRQVICAGFAGGLAASVRTGDLLIAENFSSPELLARAHALNGEKPRRFFGALVTSPTSVETVAAKAALARESGALAVDMETAAVAAACSAAGVLLLAVRAISDAAGTPLPVPFADWYDLARQRPRRWQLLKYLATHPEAVAPFASFLRALPPTRRALADFLVRFLNQPG